MHRLAAPEGSTWKTIVLFSTIAALSTFLEGYSTTYPNTAGHTLKELVNASFVSRDSTGAGLSEWSYTWYLSILLNIWFIGFPLGYLITPHLSDTYGRKVALLGANCASVGGASLSLLALFAHLPEGLILARLVSSSASGVIINVLTLIIQESVPTKLRGMCSYVDETALFAVGVIGMGIGTDALLGRNLLALMILPVLPAIFAVLTTMLLKESPKWLLLSRNDHVAAREALIFYRGSHDPDNSPEKTIEEMLKELQYQEGSTEQSTIEAVIAIVRRPHLRRALTIGFFALQLNVGVWPLGLISTSLLEAHFSLSVAQYVSCAFITAVFLAGLVGMFIVERYGRRPILLGCGCVSCISLCVYVAADVMTRHLQDGGFFKHGCVISLICYGIAYGMGIGPVASFITAEIAPQRYRALIQSLAYTANDLQVFFTSFFMLPLYRGYLGVWTFVPLLIVPSAISVLYLWFNMPETRNREVHEVVAELVAATSHPKSGKRKVISSNTANLHKLESWKV